MNITEKLKNCPVGTSLYSPIFGVCVLNSINLDSYHPIRVSTEKASYTFSKDGRIYDGEENGECMLFPSKVNRDWESYRYEPKCKVGDTLKNGNVQAKITSRDADSFMLDCGVVVYFRELGDWELVSNKFNIEDFHPFDRVLVRDDESEEWRCNILSHVDEDEAPYIFLTCGCNYRQCIPFNEDTKHLVGTQFDCSEYYKTW